MYMFKQSKVYIIKLSFPVGNRFKNNISMTKATSNIGRAFSIVPDLWGVRVYLIKGVCPQLLTNEGKLHQSHFNCRRLGVVIIGNKN
ncbi:hypothetical protein EF898_13845 [Staphylococcus aureus]|nr:hypothetical protein EF898_13845 [Staphylococcus aureus]